MTFTNRITKIIATLLLVLMLGLAFFSMRGDSATMDELAHTPAGYSYITQKDMRLNPEHPPLLKDLAGLSVWLGSKITGKSIVFPKTTNWTEKLNGQWEFGRDLLYRNGNDADSIIFWGRLPMLLIMLILGIYVFKWAHELYGNKAGLLALFLYSLSPTFIAHGRYVTTDVGAAAAFFISIYYLVKWVNNQNKKNLIIAGIVFGLALLTKFSLVLLIPYFVFIVMAWSLINYNKDTKLPHFTAIVRSLAIPLISLFLIGIIGMALIWPVYKFHILNYPETRQTFDTIANLGSYGNRLLADSVIWMSEKSILRPYGQFFHGLLMVIQRSVGGNTTYFLGEISRFGWRSYFPIVFSIKVPLVFLILILIAFLTSARNIKKLFKKENFAEFALLSFFILYWVMSIRSTLNIGVRHVLPIFPILYVLISGQIIKIKNKKLNIFLIIMLLWYAIGTIKIYPNFLTYFNEIAGGPENGYKYAIDSNLDWGQDLRRLKNWIEKNNINKIYVEYFGGGDLNYYLDGKWQTWWGERDPSELPSDSWLAVSTTLIQGGRGIAAPNISNRTDYYEWLNDYEPVTVIGNSIFVYHIQ
ncbi:ArnT family glycosyltransferase [Patescibacteria group bacterium]